MAIAMMKPIMPIVFMMEVTVVERVPTLTNVQIVCVTMEDQQELDVITYFVIVKYQMLKENNSSIHKVIIHKSHGEVSLVEQGPHTCCLLPHIWLKNGL